MQIDYNKTAFTKEEIVESNKKSMLKGIAIGVIITLIIGVIFFKYVTRNAKFNYWNNI